MSTSSQPYHAERYLTPHPTSPWTEVFQTAAAHSGDQTETKPQKPAGAQSEATDQSNATHDTLSALFQQFNKN
jgi:hypothetical protein